MSSSIAALSASAATSTVSGAVQPKKLYDVTLYPQATPDKAIVLTCQSQTAEKAYAMVCTYFGATQEDDQKLLHCLLFEEHEYDKFELQRLDGTRECMQCKPARETVFVPATEKAALCLKEGNQYIQESWDKIEERSTQTLKGKTIRKSYMDKRVLVLFFNSVSFVSLQEKQSASGAHYTLTKVEAPAEHKVAAKTEQKS